MNPFTHQNHKKIVSNLNCLNKIQKPLSARDHKRSKSYSRQCKKYSTRQVSNQIIVENTTYKQKDTKYQNKRKNKHKFSDYIHVHAQNSKQEQNSKQKVCVRPVKSSPNKCNSIGKVKNISVAKVKSKQKQKNNDHFQLKKQENLNHKKQQSQKTKKPKQIIRLNEYQGKKNKQKSKQKQQSKKPHHRRSNSISFHKPKPKQGFVNNLQLNFKNISLNADNDKAKFPYTSDYVLKNFKDYLSAEQINQLKQYKQIYYMGKNFKNIVKGTIKSARASTNNPNQIDRDDQVDHIVHQTEFISPQKKNTEDDQFYKYQIGDQIAFRYQILSSINQGSFGQVLKVYDHKSKEEQAMKIVRKSKDLIQQTFVQISILTHIKQKDKTNISGIVRIKDFLLFRNHVCILFQLLDGNLYELITVNQFKGFSQDVIRIFAVQLLNSLNFLKKEQIIHCDLKPQNLVMKSWGKTGVKIVDFGTSCFEGKQIYTYLQSRYYRAPQIIMQVPYSFPIDMWSFACILAELRLGQPLFSGRTDMEQLIYITKVLGLPSKKQGLFSLAFLQNQSLKQIIENNYISLSNSKLEVNVQQNLFEKMYKQKLKAQCLTSLEERLREKGKFNIHFLNFLQQILQWEPEKRMTPQEALQHPWIIKGLPQQIKMLYSAFNTISSLQKKKKNSKDKDSKTSSQQRSKKNSQEKHAVSQKKSKVKNTIKFNENGAFRKDQHF